MPSLFTACGVINNLWFDFRRSERNRTKEEEKLLSAFNDLREVLEADSREVSKNLGIPENYRRS